MKIKNRSLHIFLIFIIKGYTENGDAIKIDGKDSDNDIDKLIVKDNNSINKYTCFNVKLPAYLPEGYEFEQAEFYKDNSGKVENTKYAFLVFVNSETGEKFFIDERKDCEETKYEMSANGRVEKIEINGVDAVMSNNKDVDWIYDGKLCSVMGNKLSRDEVIKVAESIK